MREEDGSCNALETPLPRSERRFPPPPAAELDAAVVAGDCPCPCPLIDDEEGITMDEAELEEGAIEEGCGTTLGVLDDSKMDEVVAPPVSIEGDDPPAALLTAPLPLPLPFCRAFNWKRWCRVFLALAGGVEIRQARTARHRMAVRDCLLRSCSMFRIATTNECG